jgi:hypothetical protein
MRPLSIQMVSANACARPYAFDASNVTTWRATTTTRPANCADGNCGGANCGSSQLWQPSGASTDREVGISGGWRPQRDSNPCLHRERVMSWASRRWGRRRGYKPNFSARLVYLLCWFRSTTTNILKWLNYSSRKVSRRQMPHLRSGFAPGRGLASCRVSAGPPHEASRRGSPAARGPDPRPRRGTRLP